MLDKRFNLKNEKEMQKLWEEKKAYKFKGVDERPVYSVDTPPPTVSGKLHVGHIFSFTQSEMLVRYHRLKGENVYYPFGFDDNGLPTERLVEREEGIFAKDLPRSEFIEKCAEKWSVQIENPLHCMFATNQMVADSRDPPENVHSAVPHRLLAPLFFYRAPDFSVQSIHPQSWLSQKADAPDTGTPSPPCDAACLNHNHKLLLMID